MNITVSRLDAQRQVGGKLIIALAWLMVPIVLGARLAVQEPILGVALATGDTPQDARALAIKAAAALRVVYR